MIQTCEHCIHHGDVTDAKNNHVTVCMRHPPVIIDSIIAYNIKAGRASFGAEDLRVASCWPAVSPSASCGEFAPCGEPTPPTRRPFRVILRERHGGVR